MTDYVIAEVTFRVRYAETDAMRIVHHSNYVIYFEEARSEYARQMCYPYSQFEEEGYHLAVTELNIRYGQPTVYEQQITVRTWVTDVKSRSITFEYEVIDTESGQTLVTGQTKHICLTHDGKTARFSPEWRQRWSKGMRKAD